MPRAVASPIFSAITAAITTAFTSHLFVLGHLFFDETIEGSSAEIVIIVKPDECRGAIFITTYISEVASGSGSPALYSNEGHGKIPTTTPTCETVTPV